MTPEPSRSGVDAVRHYVVSAFTDHLAYKFSALFFAFVLWLIVSGEKLTEASVAVDVTPRVDSTLTLLSDMPPVSVTVLGRGKEVLKLYQTPPVLRLSFPEGTPDSVMIDLKTEDIRLPEGVDALVRDVDPHHILLRFEPPVLRRLPVASALRVVNDSVPMRVRLEPDSVTVRGKRHDVQSLRSVTTAALDIDARDTTPRWVSLDVPPNAVLGTPRVRVRLEPVPGSAAAEPAAPDSVRH